MKLIKTEIKKHKQKNVCALRSYMNLFLESESESK